MSWVNIAATALLCLLLLYGVYKYNVSFSRMLCSPFLSSQHPEGVLRFRVIFSLFAWSFFLLGSIGAIPTMIAAWIAHESKASSRSRICLLVGLIAAAALVLLSPRLERQFSRDYVAVDNLQTIVTAQVVYLSSSGGKWGTMEQLANAGLVGRQMDAPTYRFRVAVSENGYVATATAASGDVCYDYYVTDDEVMRYGSKSPPGKTGQAVE